MEHAHAAPLPSLDPKRIAATSAVIALHVGVLMLLMMPARVAQTVAVEEPPPIWDPIRIEIPPPPPPPQPDPIVRQDPRPTPVQQQVTIHEPPPISIDEPPGIMDVQAVEQPPVPFVDPGPPAETFMQLATRVAPAPTYPRRAIQLQLTGVVKLRIRVDASGRPVEVTVEESSGHAILDQAAVKTVQSRWLFVPATRDGAAVEAWALVPIEFVLD